MCKHIVRSFLTTAAASAALILLTAAAFAGPAEDEKPVREVLVPFEDLNVLLESAPRRVLISRAQYEALMEEAKTTPDVHAPRDVAVIAAEYEARLGDERAEITGSLTIDVLEPGLHTIGLDLSGVGLRSATLDGGPNATIGVADDGRPTLFIRGVGLHELTLEMVAPVVTDSARQTVDIRVPVPPATRFHLVAPGDVDVQSVTGGAAVASRIVQDDPETDRVTHIELIPAPGGRIALVMTLNSRLQRTERLVLARSVVVGEVTRAVEKLHATISLAVLHRAVDQFLFEVPEEFEITEVTSEQLATWTVQEQDGRHLLEVRLRNQTAGTVVLSVSALRCASRLDDWRMPQLKPIDVVGETAVVGLLVEKGLKARSVQADGLTAIDTGVLVRALPAGVFTADPGAPKVRPVVAYYAPQAGEGGFELAASFAEIPAELNVTTNLLLILEESSQQVRGGFMVLPVEEDCYELEFSVPTGWHVNEVTDAQGRALAFERFGPRRAADGPSRIQVRLPRAIKADEEQSVYFHARLEPPGWLDEWETKDAAFPIFAVTGATTDTGAIAVDARDDMDVRPTTLERLTPLDDNEKAQFGLGGIAEDLAYRYDEQPYRAGLQVLRVVPRITARTFSFFKIEPETRNAHYEIVFDVQQSRARRLSLLLPDTTPAALSITGMGGVQLKGFTHEPADDHPGMRRWTATLAEPRGGLVRLAVDFQQRIDHAEGGEMELPVIAADGVAYQSGLVAVEGGSELDVRIVSTLREVDVGELAVAQYVPGRRLLGVFEFTGESPEVKVIASRDPARDLPPAIVQKAYLVTAISAEGESQTAAHFQVRTKALFLEIALPANANLWTVTLDGEATKPQRDQRRLLLDLPPAPGGRGEVVRQLTIVYDQPIASTGVLGAVELSAPRLLYQVAGGGASEPVQVADLQWDMYVPQGHRVVDSGGTVVTHQIEAPTPAAVRLAEWIYEACGGTTGPLGGLLPSLAKARDLGKEYRYDAQAPMEGARRPSAAVGPPSDDEPSRIALPEEGLTAPPLESIKKPAQVKAELLGLRSLNIDLDPSGELIAFRSLGVTPVTEISLAHSRRLDLLSWGIGLAMALFGLARVGRSAHWKVGYIIWVAVFATFLAVLLGRSSFTFVANGAFYAAAVLIPIYMLCAVIRWVNSKVTAAHLASIAIPGRAAIAPLIIIAMLMSATPASGADVDDDDGPPVVVPEDIIIVPYDPESEAVADGTENLLIPYDRFVELWNLAHPDQSLVTEKPPASFALAGGAFEAALPSGPGGGSAAGELVLSGYLEFDIFVDGPVQVPLSLYGAVLAGADLDGEPAKLSVAETDEDPGPQQQRQSIRPPRRSLLVLHAAGKGRHRLDLSLRMPLTMQGGWRIAQATLPSAPAMAITLTVPEAGTDVRLGGVVDRTAYETTEPDQRIATALSRSGTLRIDWRPKVGRGVADPDLTADSTAVLSVQEDGLRLIWALGLEFPRSQRESFSLRIPEGYLVEKVAGVNVRAWGVSGDESGGNRALDVTLLKAARDRESFVVHLRRPTAVGGETEVEFAAPVIEVDGASLHNGSMAIRRSPMLLVRTIETAGVSRTDASERMKRLLESDLAQSPLGIRDYETYRFVTTPFALRFAAASIDSKVSAELQTILRISRRERSLESRIVLDVQDRPIHRLCVSIPDDLDLDQVTAQGASQWSVNAVGEGGAVRRVLTILFQTGRRGKTQVVLTGRLGETGPVNSVPLPRLAVLDVTRQEGHIVVQADPALSVTARDLRGCENVLPGTVFSWLQEEQRHLAQLVIRHRSGDYAGSIRLDVRQPEVTCDSITNVRVGDWAIEDTILLDFTISRAGIRTVTFLLPDYLKDARISVPLLRRKSVQAADDRHGWVRVRLDLQDAVMDRLRVLIESDRLLTTELHDAPVPIVETGSIERRYLALESAGRDEVVVNSQAGFQPLNRRAREWQAVASTLGVGPTEIYISRDSAEQPSLAFKLSRREAVRTAGASIGLAETLLALDSNGAYRAAQLYRVDNNTEQFLEIELPAGADLWTAYVAGEPVKPVQVADPTKPNHLRLPLVKTAPGDLDYEVVIKYGGAMEKLGVINSVSFPLIRTVNINVELSRARLFLDEAHSWFDFGGAMRLVTESGEFEAGYVSYQTRQLERLSKTLSGDNELARARGAANLERYKAVVEEYGQQLGRFGGGGGELQRQQMAQSQALEEAEEQLRNLRRQPETREAFDNRARLGQLFQEQKGSRASNVVKELGTNFADRDALEAEVLDGDEVARFNDAWLMQNALEADAGLRDQVERLEVAGDMIVTKGGKVAAGRRRSPVAPNVGQRAVMDELQQAQQMEAPASSPRRGGVGGRGREVDRSEESRYYDDRRARAGEFGDTRTELLRSRMDDKEVLGEIIAGQWAGTSGLMSLDIDLPQRGIEYRFTTPRGEVEITARAASASMLQTLRRLGLFVVGAIVVLVLWRLVRGREEALMNSTPVSIVLIVIGLASLIGGLMPLAGVFILVIGIVLRVSQHLQARQARRAAAATVR